MTRLALLLALASPLHAGVARAWVTVEVEGEPALAAELALELGPDGEVRAPDQPAAGPPVDARVRVVRAPEATSIEVRHRALAEPLRSATAPDADARTLAIVAADLIEEADQRWLDHLPSAGLAAPPARADRATAGHARATLDRGVDLGPSAPEPRSEQGLAIQVGAGGLLAVNAESERVGPVARLIVGVRFNPRYRLGAIIDLGGLSEPRSEGLHIGPWGRACAEGAIGGPAQPIAVHIALHACVVAGGTRQPALPADATGFDPTLGPYAEIGWASFAFGGAIQVGVRLDGDLHLWLRADVDGTTVAGEGVVAPGLSLMLGSP